MTHAIKIEELELTKSDADKLVEHARQFIMDIGWDEIDRDIEAVECRRCDGFIPYSHNKGGVEAVCFADQAHLVHEGTGFKEADAVLEKYYQMDIEQFAENKKIDPKTYGIDWNEELVEEFDEYRILDTEATVMFQCRIMFHSDNEASVFLSVSVSDAPYHRTSDTLLEYDIQFQNPEHFKKQLDALLNNQDVQCFRDNIVSDSTF